MKSERSPGIKLLLAGLVGAVLLVPLMMVYWLVYDRESQSAAAQAQITAGWGGAQTVTGPVLVIPFTGEQTQTETVNGTQQTVTRRVRQELFVSPTTQAVETSIAPERKGYAIYESVVYDSAMQGTARFELPGDLARLDIDPASLQLEQAQLRFGVSDPRGLRDDARVTANGDALELTPGNGPAATGGAGFSGFVTWDGAGALNVAWQYGIRGSHSLALVPRGGKTAWKVTSPWPHPSFAGSFLPDGKTINGDGFSATYEGISNLALGRPLVATADDGPPDPYAASSDPNMARDPAMAGPSPGSPSMVASIGLVEPVDLYSQVDRAVKYGFLFIGFTFATFLMFDIVGGARVAAAEYLLTGAGLVMFFVLLLALAEVIGFALAYAAAAAAVIGLLTAYSAAVLGTWRRAGFIGAMLAGLYALLFVLLSMETYALLIGAVLLFVALAGIMYATRAVNWGGASAGEEVAASA